MSDAARMPAEELRAAAKLMRERAGLMPPRPWYLLKGEIGTQDPFTVISQSGITEWAQYLASWHPGVALAVADWLNAEASSYEVCGIESAHFDKALAVARAYLGTPAGETP